jgi:hypothetical protein
MPVKEEEEKRRRRGGGEEEEEERKRKRRGRGEEEEEDFSTRASPCAITYQLDSTPLYQLWAFAHILELTLLLFLHDTCR